MSKRESFYISNREIRVQTGADGSRSIVGSILYGSPSVDMGFTELIAPGAFASALQQGAEVLCLRDHDPSILLGNTKAGTLTLTDSQTGLNFRCKLPSTTGATDLIESMSRGDISGVSFGFTTTKDAWTDEAGVLTRTLLSVELFEVSVCSFAAYPSASAAIRSIPAHLRSMLKRSTDGCECDCEECTDGNCDQCSMLDCEDAQCAENGCPNQDGHDDEDDDFEDRTLLRIAVMQRL
jgi:HK97 family phage prohead protease